MMSTTEKKERRPSVEERLEALEAENSQLRDRLDQTVADFGSDADLDLIGQFIEDPTVVRGLVSGLRPYWAVPKQSWQMRNYKYRKATQADFVDTDEGSAKDHWEAVRKDGIAEAGHVLYVCRQEDFDAREKARELRGAAAAGERDLAGRFADREQAGGTAFFQAKRHAERRRE